MRLSPMQEHMIDIDEAYVCEGCGQFKVDNPVWDACTANCPDCASELEIQTKEAA